MSETCYACKNPATCVGQCEDSELEFCCDECCGHGNEDGWCIHLSLENIPKIIDRANRALRIEKENAAYDKARATRGAAPIPESPWKGMDSAPRDGRLVELNVIFEEHPFEDDDESPQQTIGLNNFDNDEVDEWKFAGWCWNDDHFTQGQGKPVGWRPFVRPAAPDSQNGGEG